MKTSPSKSLLSWAFLLLFVGGVLWAFSSLNAEEGGPLLILTDKFTAVQNIQEIHLNQDNQSDKIGLMNSGGNTLGIGTVDTSNNRVGTLRNDASLNASVIAGNNNKNQTQSVTSLIIGGAENKLNRNALNSLIIGGMENSIAQDKRNSLAFAATKSNIYGLSSVALGVEKANIRSDNSVAYAGEKVNITASESFSIGSNISVSGQGVFAFNGKNKPLNVDKKYTFIVQSDRGVIVGDNNSKRPDIQLTVNGAIRVGNESPSVDGVIFSKQCNGSNSFSCLCTIADGKPVSLSTDPVCSQVCSSSSTSCTSGPSSSVCGSRAMTYEADETDWRDFSTFCVNGGIKGATPNFPQQGETVSWYCETPTGTSIVCKASRKDILGCNKCASKGFPYCFDVSFDPHSSECQGGGD